MRDGTKRARPLPQPVHCRTRTEFKSTANAAVCLFRNAEAMRKISYSVCLTPLPAIRGLEADCTGNSSVTGTSGLAASSEPELSPKIPSGALPPQARARGIMPCRQTRPARARASSRCRHRMASAGRLRAAAHRHHLAAMPQPGRAGRKNQSSTPFPRPLPRIAMCVGAHSGPVPNDHIGCAGNK